MFKSFKDRIKDKELLSTGLLRSLILLSIIITGYGLFSPIFGSNDSAFYSTIAKNIVLSHDWVNLTFVGHDWLDKPHLPFWLTAISYKIFGITTFAYILPGFLFNLLGGLYTYRLGTYLYSRQVGLLSALFYFTSLHLMLSAIDVRQEAFLLGEITPACYYWLRYYQTEKITLMNLVLGAFFTALAVMTKGIFTLITISSGVLAISCYLGQVKVFFSKKWLFALLLSFILILPELVCLFLQFDLHPEKLVFGHYRVSGLGFFFWGSQFGRFFGTGPYVNNNHDTYAHYFYFMHTFLWAFLPWSLVFITSIFASFGLFRLDSDNIQVKVQNTNQIFLLASFFITFLLFSLTKFQLDYYTNIIMPFAAIICANWVYNYLTRLTMHWIFPIQVAISMILVSLVLVLSFLVFDNPLLMFLISSVVIILFLLFFNNRYLNKAIVFPSLAINLVFIFVMMVNNQVYTQYDAGYQVANYLQSRAHLLLVDYQANLNSLEFYSSDPYERASEVSAITQINQPYYLLVNSSEFISIEPQLPNATLLKQFQYLPQNRFTSLLFNTHELTNSLETLSLYEVNITESHI